MVSTEAKNLLEVQERIHQAALKYGRDPDSIVLIAVSKTKPIDAILAVYQAGQRCFGENYVQEAVSKIESIDLPDVEWHFIGPIQSNKTRLIAESVDWVHSVDRIKVAERLSEQRPPELPPLNLCLQVNISEEDTKAGVTLDRLDDLAVQVYRLPGLTLRGLMAIPQRETDFEAQREVFSRLADAKDRLNADHGWKLDTLSMGMSGDMEAAIAAGATMVRVGTDIFGKRNYPAQSE